MIESDTTEPFPPFAETEEEEPYISPYDKPDLTNVPPPRAFGNLYKWRLDNKLMHPVWNEFGTVLLFRMLLFSLFMLLVGIEAGREIDFFQIHQTASATVTTPIDLTNLRDLCNNLTKP